MKIGVGTGQIGSAVASLLRAADRDVVRGSREPQADEVSVDGAIRFGEVILIAVTNSARPDLAPRLADAGSGKIVVDAGNPDPERDGEFGRQGLAHPDGSGAPVAALLPNLRLVRPFSTV